MCLIHATHDVCEDVIIQSTISFHEFTVTSSASFEATTSMKVSDSAVKACILGSSSPCKADQEYEQFGTPRAKRSARTSRNATKVTTTFARLMAN